MSASRSGFVALVGWTNVGKSTLLNRLVGEKIAAVADVPQTTRQRITAVLTLAGRGQIVFVDTPGFHEPRHRMNRQMVAAARQALGSVDLAVQVIDAVRGPGPGDRRLAELLGRAGTRRLAVLNKIDRLRDKTPLLPMLELTCREWGCEEAIPLSALTGDGCERLVDAVLARLPAGEPPFPDDYLTDQSQRALAAEWIREKLLHQTRQELPHATAVRIDRWETTERGIVRIEGTVLVERESQKPIVVGAEGRLLRSVGSEARAELERMLDARVYLRLWVRVQPDWRNDRRTLDELGLG